MTIRISDGALERLIRENNDASLDGVQPEIEPSELEEGGRFNVTPPVIGQITKNAVIAERRERHYFAQLG